MGARRLGRERALQALYQLESDAKLGSQGALDAAWTAHDDEGPRDPAADVFAKELIAGVQAHAVEIDKLIEDHSHNWRLDRMQRIDRNVLRIGVFELKHLPEIPRKVTINEAVGPVLFKLGLDRAGETSSSPEPTRPASESLS